MRNSQVVRERKVRRLAVFVAALCVFATLPLLSSARARASSVNVANNSGREIIHIYLAHADQDDWGANQLGSSTIPPGQSFTISNVSWDQPQVKVVAEDKNGCFLSGVVALDDSATWTITNDTAADCGL
ncbi:MAG TPA: hypothetical protein VFA21_11675 [Pyrinomonadaceae bacterium]|jgi:hypothetical protein|nr:hypothetical protein [Pyrinomonadaceae bacterium]